MQGTNISTAGPSGSSTHDIYSTCEFTVLLTRVSFLHFVSGDRIRTATLSLDGLLDYDESDKDEATFELSLFAESFQDMLMRDYGQIIFDALQAFRSALLIPVMYNTTLVLYKHLPVLHPSRVCQTFLWYVWLYCTTCYVD